MTISRSLPLALALLVAPALAHAQTACSPDDCFCDASFVRSGLFPTAEAALAPSAVHAPAVNYDADGDGDQDAWFAVGPGQGDCALDADGVTGDRGGLAVVVHDPGGYRSYLIYPQAQPSEHHGFSLMGTLVTGGRLFAVVHHGESFDTEGANHYQLVWLNPGAGTNAAFEDSTRTMNESIGFEPGEGGAVLETAVREPVRNSHGHGATRYRVLRWNDGAHRFDAGTWSTHRPALRTTPFPPVSEHGGPETQVAVCRD